MTKNPKNTCRRKVATTVAGSVAMTLAASAFTALPAQAAGAETLAGSSFVATTADAAAKALSLSPKLVKGTALKDQEGWSFVGGNFDFEVADEDTLRLSNAYRDGTITQLISPTLGASASENSEYDRFEAEFTVASSTGQFQDGLRIEVAPDNGGGSRSGGTFTLWHNPKTQKLEIGAVWSTSTGWSNKTLASVDPETAHTIKIVERFVVDGDDFADVYVDGAYAGRVGTYEWYAESEGNALGSLNSLLFRSSLAVPNESGVKWDEQPAVPANKGNGFLISDISYSVSSTDVQTVTSTDQLLTADTGSRGHNVMTSEGLKVWTETFPQGEGSTAKAAGYLAFDEPISLADAGVPAITLADGGKGGKPALQLAVDRDGDGKWDGYLSYEPSFYGEGKWWTNKAGFGVASGSGYTSLGTLAEYVTANPKAQILAVGYTLGSGVVGYSTIESIEVADMVFNFVGETVDGGFVTDDYLHGWTLPEGAATFAEDGVQLKVNNPVDGVWDEPAMTFDYDGYLAEFVDTEFEATADVYDSNKESDQFVNIKLVTDMGVLTYEHESTYEGNWWSKSSFGITTGMGYPTFGTLDQIQAANPGLKVKQVLVAYTNRTEATATISSVTFAGQKFEFAARSLSTVAVDVDKDEYGTAGTLSISVESEGDAPTGTVTVSGFGDFQLGADGTVSVPLPADLTAGKKDLAVSYSGDNFVAPSSANASFEVAQASSSVSASVDKGEFGEAGSIDVEVSADNVTPTGTITVSGISGSVALDGNGRASVAIPANLAVGNHTFTVTYSGDANVAGSSDQVSTSVSKATSSVKAGNLTQTAGTNAVLPVTVSGTDATGTVTVKKGSKVVGTATVRNGSANVTLKAGVLVVGTHDLLVQYSGSSTVAASSTSMTLTVKKSSATFTTSWSKAVYGTGVTVKANVKGASGSATGQVEIWEGSKRLARGTLSKGTVTLKLSNGYAVGKHNLSVRYLGSSTVDSRTLTTVVRVEKAPSKATVKLAKQTVKTTQRAKATVNVTAPNLKVSGKATVVVTPAKGKAVSVTANVKNGKATVTLPKLSAGKYKVSVKFAGAAGVNGNSSGTTNLLVTR